MTLDQAIAQYREARHSYMQMARSIRAELPHCDPDVTWREGGK